MRKVVDKSIGTLNSYNLKNKKARSIKVVSLVTLLILVLSLFYYVSFGSTVTKSLGTNVTLTYDTATKEAVIESTNGTVGEINITSNYDNPAIASLGNGAANAKVITFKNKVKLTNASSKAFFRGLKELETINNLENLDTSEVTSMRFMFDFCLKLKELDLTSFDTSKVTDMNYMFGDCHELIKINWTSFDTSKVTSMDCMFEGCLNLNNLDVSSFDTANVKNMNGMFGRCRVLENLDVSNFNTSNVTTMSNMFSGCDNLKKLDVSKFNTTNVTKMTRMFLDCYELTELDLSSFNTSNVTNMSQMFMGCKSLKNLDLRNFNTQKITSINYYMNKMFVNCESLESLNISNFEILSNSPYSAEWFTNDKMLNHIYTPKDYNQKQYDIALPAKYKNVTYEDNTAYTNFKNVPNSIHLVRCFTVTYCHNGQTKTESKEADEDYSILDYCFSTPIPDGKKFTKWNTKEDGTGIDYNVGQIYTDNANLTLYAQIEDIKYTVEFMDGTTNEKTEIVIYNKNATAPVLTKPGYTLSWDKPYTNVKSDLVVNAIWTPRDDTPYTVEHWLEQTDGTFKRDDTLTQSLQGTTGTTATAQYKSNIPGYEKDINNANKVESGTITGDGNLVLKLYYKLREDIPYTLEYYYENVQTGQYEIDNNLTKTQTGMMGQQVTAPQENKAGYVEDTTHPNRKESGQILADRSLVLKRYYKLRDDIPYKIEYYYENAQTGNYEIDNNLTKTQTGMMGQQVTAPQELKTGYVENTTHPNRKESGAILVDGTLVLRRYYEIKGNIPYKVEYYYEDLQTGDYEIDNTLTENNTGKLGKTVTAGQHVKAGYVEDTTHPNRKESGQILEDGSLVLRRYYKLRDDIPYKIEYYYENAQTGNYEIDNTLTENNTGKPGQTVTAGQKPKAGYVENTTHPNRKESGQILADGSLVLRRYYELKNGVPYKVEHYFEQEDGTFEIDDTLTENLTGKAGVTAIAKPHPKPGYVEDTTHPNRIPSGIILEDGSLVLRLYYVLSEEIPYKIEHWIEKEDGSYEIYTIDSLAGTTGEKVEAEAKIITGYTEDITNENRVIEGIVQADGSLVLKVYYKKTEEPTPTPTPEQKKVVIEDKTVAPMKVLPKTGKTGIMMIISFIILGGAYFYIRYSILNKIMK